MDIYTSANNDLNKYVRFNYELTAGTDPKFVFSVSMIVKTRTGGFEGYGAVLPY